MATDLAVIRSNRFSATVLALLCLLAGSAEAFPSRAFYQELALVSPSGQFSLDVYNSSGMYSASSPSQFRLGLPWRNEASLSSEGFGYKQLIRSNLAAYGLVKFSLVENERSEYTLGMSYRHIDADFYINTGLEVGDNGSGSGVVLNGAAFYELPTMDWLGRLHGGAEVILPGYSNANMTLAFGVRWLYRQFVATDIVLLASGGSAGEGIRAPAALRVNLSF